MSNAYYNIGSKKEREHNFGMQRKPEGRAFGKIFMEPFLYNSCMISSALNNISPPLARYFFALSENVLLPIDGVECDQRSQIVTKHVTTSLPNFPTTFEVAESQREDLGAHCDVLVLHLKSG